MNATDALSNLGSTLEELDTRIKAIEDQPQGGGNSTITVTGQNREPVVIEGKKHKMFEQCVNIVDQGIPLMMVGGAGSGKTFLGEQITKALGIEYYYTGAILEKQELLGYNDVNGNYVRTQFREAWEHGGGFSWDEIDDSAPEALVAFNPMVGLNIKSGSFPDGTVDRHPDCRIIASGNTYGKGADRIYVGRTQLDGATLSRYAIVTIDYDLELEHELSCNENWTNQVQSWRHSMNELGIRHIISPRASINGGLLIAAGLSQDETAEFVVWQGLAEDQVMKIKSHARVHAVQAA